MNKWKNNKYVLALQQGFQDIKTVMQEGNAKLFLKQFVALVAILVAWKMAAGKFEEQINNYQTQISSLQVQRSSEKEYVSSKELLITLEPQFPSADEKGEWLRGKLIEEFDKLGIVRNIAEQQTETSGAGSVIASRTVGFSANFKDFIKVLTELENQPDYLKVSEFTLDKDTDIENIGLNKISIRVNTAFPNERIISKQMFKDYDQLMEKIKKGEK